MRALRDRWTLSSRLYDRADEGQPRKKVLDASIGWQNYQDAYGDYYPAEPGYSEPDGGGYSARFTRLPRLVRLGNDGKKRVYPVPGNDQVWIELAKPQEITLGQPTSKVGGVWTWDRPAYTFSLKVGPSGVKFGLILKRAVGINTLTIPFTAQGLTRQGNLLLANGEAVAALRRPTVRWPGMTVEQELDPPAVDVAFTGGAIVLSFDLTGLPYPIEIDPPIDVSVGASLDDTYVRRQTSTLFNDTGTGLPFGNINATNYGYGGSMRFTGINIPSGATIDVAYITYIAQSTQAGTTVNSDICAENASNPTAPTTYLDHTGRTRTTSVAYDSVAAQTAGDSIQTPSIVAPIQTVVTDNGGTGSALQMFIEDKLAESSVGAWRGVASWDHATYAPPAIHIEYTEAGGARRMAVIG